MPPTDSRLPINLTSASKRGPDLFVGIVGARLRGDDGGVFQLARGARDFGFLEYRRAPLQTVRAIDQIFEYPHGIFLGARQAPRSR
jgi:hypothetical protein